MMDPYVGAQANVLPPLHQLLGSIPGGVPGFERLCASRAWTPRWDRSCRYSRFFELALGLLLLRLLDHTGHHYSIVDALEGQVREAGLEDQNLQVLEQSGFVFAKQPKRERSRGEICMCP